MMQPNKRKHKKEFRGSMAGIDRRGSEVTFGEYGLQAVEAGWITGRQLEAARRAMVHATKRRGRVWIKVFPHKPVTKKSDEQTRGGGKGEVDHYVAVVRPGRILMEIGGVSWEIAEESLRLASHKFPVKTKVVTK